MPRVGKILLTVCCVLFLVSASVVLTLACRPLYYYDIGRLKIAETSGYSVEEIRENYDALIAYNLSPFQEKLAFPTLAMSEAGEIHFREVKAIFQAFLWMMAVTAAPVAAGSIAAFRKRQYGYLKWTGICLAVIPAALAALVACSWDWLFVTFHELVFDNDYWLFDPAADPVITILPDEFFMHCALMILGWIVVGAAVCLAAYIKKQKNL